MAQGAFLNKVDETDGPDCFIIKTKLSSDIALAQTKLISLYEKH
jgi:hypothetical protein